MLTESGADPPAKHHSWAPSHSPSDSAANWVLTLRWASVRALSGWGLLLSNSLAMSASSSRHETETTVTVTDYDSNKSRNHKERRSTALESMSGLVHSLRSLSDDIKCPLVAGPRSSGSAL